MQRLKEITYTEAEKALLRRLRGEYAAFFLIVEELGRTQCEMFSWRSV
jgi:hypothetical protein